MRLIRAIAFAAAGTLVLGGCAHPQPTPPPATLYDLSWGNPNTYPVCSMPLVFPCQFSQTVINGTLSQTIAISTRTYPAAAGATYQVVINAYSPAGVLVSSKPSTVTVP